MFTACFAKERNKDFFSLHQFNCSWKEEEAKAQILKAQEDEQNLLSSSNIDSLSVLLTARSLLHIKNIPVSTQTLVEQTLQPALTHFFSIHSVGSLERIQFVWKWAEKCPKCISEGGLAVMKNSTWNWTSQGWEMLWEKVGNVFDGSFPFSWTIS